MHTCVQGIHFCACVLKSMAETYVVKDNNGDITLCTVLRVKKRIVYMLV